MDTSSTFYWVSNFGFCFSDAKIVQKNRKLFKIAAPIVFTFLLIYCWAVVYSRYVSLKKEDQKRRRAQEGVADEMEAETENQIIANGFRGFARDDGLSTDTLHT